jgi:hypothetical protein
LAAAQAWDISPTSLAFGDIHHFGDEIRCRHGIIARGGAVWA